MRILYTLTPVMACGTGPISSQLGGPVNYAFFSVWLALGFSGWIIGCAGLSALQRYENHSGISVLGELPQSSSMHPFLCG